MSSFGRIGKTTNAPAANWTWNPKKCDLCSSTERPGHATSTSSARKFNNFVLQFYFNLAIVTDPPPPPPQRSGFIRGLQMKPLLWSESRMDRIVEQTGWWWHLSWRLSGRASAAFAERSRLITDGGVCNIFLRFCQCFTSFRVLSFSSTFRFESLLNFTLGTWQLLWNINKLKQVHKFCIWRTICMQTDFLCMTCFGKNWLVVLDPQTVPANRNDLPPHLWGPPVHLGARTRRP